MGKVLRVNYPHAMITINEQKVGFTMDNIRLQKAINNPTDVLAPVLNASYQLTPVPKMKIIEIAINVNKALGYELFTELYYPRLVTDFSIVTRAVQQHALKSK